MLKIESNLKINGIHWGLAFVDGLAYTVNASLAAKLQLKGYVVTDQQPAAEHIVAGDIITESSPSPTPSSPAQADTDQTVSQLEQPPAITPVETPSVNPADVPKPKPTRPRKKAVTADAADESGV